MFKRILVPLDGSDLAEHAVPVAARLAQAIGGTVILLRVVSIPVPAGKYSSAVYDPLVIDDSLDVALDYLKRVARSDALSHCTVEVQSLGGATAPTILSAVSSFQAGLVVMCSHGHTNLTRWVLGSVAQKVARHCPVPALILHADTSATFPCRPDIGNPLTAIVSLDGSAFAESALQPAAQILAALATPGKAVLHLVEVISLPATYGHLRSQTPFEAEIKAREKQEAETYLASLKERLNKEMLVYGDLTITTSVVVDADIAGAILQAAEHGQEWQETQGSVAQFIAMSTHGRGGLSRWVMGSITERVLHAAPLSLLVVRPQAGEHGHEYATDGKGTMQEEVFIEDKIEMGRD